jgi:hypothetical protein
MATWPCPCGRGRPAGRRPTALPLCAGLASPRAGVRGQRLPCAAGWSQIPGVERGFRCGGVPLRLAWGVSITRAADVKGGVAIAAGDAAGALDVRRSCDSPRSGQAKRGPATAARAERRRERSSRTHPHKPMPRYCTEPVTNPRISEPPHTHTNQPMEAPPKARRYDSPTQPQLSLPPLTMESKCARSVYLLSMVRGGRDQPRNPSSGCVSEENGPLQPMNKKIHDNMLSV